MKKQTLNEQVFRIKEMMGKIINEQAYNDAGEPMMTHQQYRIYSEPSESDYDDKWYKKQGGGWRKKTNESVNESKKDNDDIYHKTYTSAINAGLEYAEKKGYTYDQEKVASEIGMGPKKPKEGDTNRFTISLKKDDKEQKKALHIQVYGMKEKYELNCYIN